jgi:hypothetical protein
MIDKALLKSSDRRREPYTVIGIRRLKCFRPHCNNRAEFTWQICADGNIYRPVCRECDLELNEMVLKWASLPGWEDKLAEYKKRGADPQ